MKMMNRKLMMNYAACVLAAAVFVVFGTKALAADKDELKGVGMKQTIIRLRWVMKDGMIME